MSRVDFETRINHLLITPQEPLDKILLHECLRKTALVELYKKYTTSVIIDFSNLVDVNYSKTFLIELRDLIDQIYGIKKAVIVFNNDLQAKMMDSICSNLNETRSKTKKLMRATSSYNKAVNMLLQSM